MKSVHFVISGKVQGVFFRDTAKRMASQIGIKGWIRNTDDGTIEILAQGSESQLSEFERWCRTGPPVAKIDSVEKEDMECGECVCFEVRY